MPERRIIIIGAVAAGTAAAAEARRTNSDAQIILIDRGPDISYSACEMPIYVAGDIASDERLVRFTPAAFAERYRVDVRVLTSVLAINAETRHIDVLDERTGEKEQLWYDALILATGVRAHVPEALQTASHHVHVLRRLEDARAIRTRLERDGKGHAVVAGAGYVGLDGVEGLTGSGWRVTLLASGGRILKAGLDQEMSMHVGRWLSSHGVQVRDERATGLDVSPDGRIRAVRTDTGERIGCDLVLAATGTRPNSELAASAGIKVEATGGIQVNETLQTSEPSVWACGDVVAYTDLMTGSTHPVPLALNAFRSGRVAGRNAARGGVGRAATMQHVIHAAGVAVAGLEIGHTGLTHEGALASGLDAVAVDIRHRSASSNSPNKPLYVRLVGERNTRRLLGAQLVGEEGAAQRTNTVTALLRAHATVDDAYEVDYLYTPKLAPAHDALFVAARQLQKKLDTSGR